ncbi:MAG: polysaccharide deacetylase family protein, partial [Alphaproteobacteria bacterium]
LGEIIDSLRTGKPLPDRTIALSIDDAFLSVYTEAWPRLKEAGLPFTLFVATNPVDLARKPYMNWAQVAELAQSELATIGSQTASHLHMAASSAKRNASDLAKSNIRFKEKLGFVPKLIAYPYGEYSLAVRAAVKAAGFKAGFGQHSGVLHASSAPFFLPRFALNETYGDITRFRLAARALPLPVKEIVPADPLLSSANNPPPFGFTVTGAAAKNISRLACYTAGQGKARIERLGSKRIEVRVERAFGPGRTRINCTMPAGNGRWRWFGMQFYLPKG